MRYRWLFIFLCATISCTKLWCMMCDDSFFIELPDTDISNFLTVSENSSTVCYHNIFQAPPCISLQKLLFQMEISEYNKLIDKYNRVIIKLENYPGDGWKYKKKISTATLPTNLKQETSNLEVKNNNLEVELGHLKLYLKLQIASK